MLLCNLIIIKFKKPSYLLLIPFYYKKLKRC